ncbi:MAG TPA: hypothetical protein PLZ15_02795 [Melioribacteraceae bacterium]|nr:hypothetical protein [Melioribacteraceae bacterium]
MKKIFSAILISFLFISVNYGQTFGGSLMLGSPQGDFRTNVDRLGYGIQVHGTLWAPSNERPFTVGLNLGYMVYGEISERRPLSNTIPDVMVEVNRTNNLANLHLLLQISPFTGTVRPYIEGLFGGAYIFTTSEVKSESTQITFAESTNWDDFTWSYGAGAGLLLLISKDMAEVKNLYLDIKARYVYGSEAQYLTEDDITINNNRIIYSPRRSKTDLLTFHIGVVAYF